MEVHAYMSNGETHSGADVTIPNVPCHFQGNLTSQDEIRVVFPYLEPGAY